MVCFPEELCITCSADNYTRVKRTAAERSGILVEKDLDSIENYPKNKFTHNVRRGLPSKCKCLPLPVLSYFSSSWNSLYGSLF